MNETESVSANALARISSLLWVIVIAIVFVFCFYASSLCIALLLAALLAILVDPVVSWLERGRLPRSLCAALVILAGLLLLTFVGYLGYDKASDYFDDFPVYAEKIRALVRPVTVKIEKFQESANRLNPAPQKTKPVPVRVNQSSWPSYLVRGISTVWGAIIVAGVVPFLMFFMLLRKEHIYSWLCNTFGARTDIPVFVARVSRMIRGFVLGNLIIALISAAVLISMLLVLGMTGAVALGIVGGFLNPVPYVGALLAMTMPLLAGTQQFAGPGPFLIIILTVVVLHLISANLLMPKLVGSRVNVDPVAATVGLLFWGWLWGAIGVLLAVPLTAFVKLVADTNPALIHVSNLLAERPRPVSPWARAGNLAVWRTIPFLGERFRHRPKP